MTLDPMRAQIEKRLKVLLSGGTPENLYEPMAYLLKAGGKRIRPLLVLLSCKAVNGKTRDALNAAAAVEILHTFTLVHDDIMDHDDLRRGLPAVHIRWDEPTAILAGDGLVTLAYRTLLKTRHPDLVEILNIFTDGLLELCEGQALDKAFESRKQIPLTDYLVMIEKKTSKLIEVSCEIGAVLGNARAQQRTALKRFAKKLGTAFQIQDDLLDVDADSSILGKPAFSDIMERKKTFLTIHFDENASPVQKKQFERLFGKMDLSEKDTADIRRLFEQTGTLSATRRLIHRLINESVTALKCLPDSQAKRMLADFALSIRNRHY